MSKKAYHFHGITVLVPPQNSGIEIIPIDKGLNPEDWLNKSTNHRIVRMIANIALVERNAYYDRQLIPVTSFDPPIEFRVNYNFLDVFKSGGDIDALKLAFWDGSAWISISDSYHDYNILPASTGQIGEVVIREWPGDPPIAWIT